MTIVSSGKNWTTAVTGTTNDYFLAGSWRLSSGSTFTDGEERAGKAVCVLGATVTKNLFGTQDPVGNEIWVKKFSCQVIGLLISEGQASMGRDQDDTIIIPLRTLQRRLSGSQDVAEVMVSVNDDRSSGHIQRQIAALLRERRHVPDKDIAEGELLSPERRRCAIEHVREEYQVSKRRACRVEGQLRGTQRYPAAAQDAGNPGLAGKRCGLPACHGVVADCGGGRWGRIECSGPGDKKGLKCRRNSGREGRGGSGMVRVSVCGRSGRIMCGAMIL